MATTANTCAWTRATLSETSFDGPSLSVMEGRLVLAWSGTDAARRINTSESTGTLEFRNKRTYNRGSGKTPQVLSYRGAGTRPVTALPLFIYSDSERQDEIRVSRWP